MNLWKRPERNNVFSKSLKVFIILESAIKIRSKYYLWQQF